MLFRKIFDLIFASPVSMVASVVSIACISILVVKVSSNIAPSSGAEGISSGASSNAVSFQSNDSRSENVSYEKQVNDAPSDDLNSGFQSNSYSPSAAGNNTNRNNNTSRNNNTNRKAVDSYSDDHGYSDETDSYEPTETDNQRPSILNFSTSNSLNSVSTTNNASTTSSSTTTSGSTVDASNNDGNTGPTVKPDEVDEGEEQFPASLEYEVPIDFEETQTISCRPIVANGPPCMCTFTVTNEDGTISQPVDNCG